MYVPDVTKMISITSEVYTDSGLTALKKYLGALKIPVTWTLDPALHGTSLGTKAEVIVDADVDVFRHSVIRSASTHTRASSPRP